MRAAACGLKAWRPRAPMSPFGCHVVTLLPCLVNFDDLGCQPSNPGDAGGAGSAASDSFDAASWQHARQRAMEAVEAALRIEGTSERPLCEEVQQRVQREQQTAEPGQQHTPQPQPWRLVIADDNMQLRSMRRQCYLLARAAQAAAVLIYVRCSEQVAQQRNAARSPGHRVPAEVVSRMAEKLEEPAGGSEGSCGLAASRISSGGGLFGSGNAGWMPADKAASSSSGSSGIGPAWEAASLIVWDSNQALTPAAVASLWRQVWQRWGPAAPPLRDAAAEAAARSAAQAATAASLAHAVDVATRQVLSDCMAQLAWAAQQRKRALAQQLNAARRQLLQEAAAQGPGFSQLGAALQGAAPGGETAETAEPGASKAKAEGGNQPEEGAAETPVAAAARHWAAAYRRRCESILASQLC